MMLKFKGWCLPSLDIFRTCTFDDCKSRDAVLALTRKSMARTVICWCEPVTLFSR
jgi:hypothetical protein